MIATLDDWYAEEDGDEMAIQALDAVEFKKELDYSDAVEASKVTEAINEQIKAHYAATNEILYIPVPTMVNTRVLSLVKSNFTAAGWLVELCDEDRSPKLSITFK